MNEDLIEINDKVFLLRQQYDIDSYTYRVTNSAGQTVELSFSNIYQDRLNMIKCWSVMLYVNKKSRGYEFGKSTGKAGMESLLIAKEILRYHIDYVRELNSFWNNYIYIWADDNRRMRVYERGLKDLRFVIANESWGKGHKLGKCLKKIIS